MLPQNTHFGKPPSFASVLSWKQLRINRCRKKASWSFPKLTRSSNFWKMKAVINPLSKGSFMTTQKMESQEEPAQTILIALLSFMYYLSMVCSSSKSKILFFITSLPIIVVLWIRYMCPSSNHPFELLFFTVSPVWCALYVLINCFSLVICLILPGPCQRT